MALNFQSMSLKTAIVLILVSKTLSDTSPMCSVVQGLPGLNGRDGRDGANGFKGDPGPPGEPGIPGIRGSSGPPGKLGPKGNHGDTGPTGDKGASGNVGAKGSPGQKGDKGDSTAESVANIQKKLSSIEEQLRDLQSSMAAQKKAWLFSNGANYGNKIFASNGKELTYDESKEICSNAGGQLASPKNQQENQAVLDIAKNHKRLVYLGITDKQTEGTFRYPNGELIEYSNWRTGEPNQTGEEDCVEMQIDGLWNDRGCQEKHLTICEFS